VAQSQSTNLKEVSHLSPINAALPEGENAAKGRGQPRRYDPDRKQRIIEAALEVIAEHGAASTTHRKVAEVAQVPLGSLTYHFKDLDELLAEAFSRLADEVATKLESSLAKADGKEKAREAVAQHIAAEPRFGFMWACELNSLAAHHSPLRLVRDKWVARNRAALEQHFDSETAMMLLALIEGLAAHSILGHISRLNVLQAVNRITATK
jgi:DNA-binding transcriptional regulator YbjK